MAKRSKAKNKERDGAANELIINYMTLRKFIGWLVFLFPFAVYLGNWALFTRRVRMCLFASSDYLPDSLSGYYYTHMRSVFVGGLWAIGVFLIAYNGYEKWDRWVTNIAGLSAIILACFPTKRPQLSSNKCGPVVPVKYASSPNQTTISHVHLGAMIALFVMVAIMAYLFTKGKKSVEVGGRAAEHPQGTTAGSEQGATGGEPGDVTSQTTKAGGNTADAKGKNSKKRARNIIYYICAAVIAASGIVALVTAHIWKHNVTPWLLYCEISAFIFFGISWAVKGQTILLPKRWKSPDSPAPSPRRASN